MLVEVTAAVLAASDAGGGSIDLTQLVNFGVLGIVVTLVVLGYFWPRPAVVQLIKDKTAAEGQRDALLETISRDVVPVLHDLNSQVVPTLKKLSGEVRGINDRLDLAAGRVPERDRD